MRKAMRVLAVVLLGTTLLALSTAQADSRTDRGVKGASLSIHMASTTPVDGYRKTVADDGEALYIAPRASWTAVDVLSGQLLASRAGASVELSLSGDATKHLSAMAHKGSNAQLAVFVGREMVGAGTVTPQGRVSVMALTGAQADQLMRAVNGEAVISTGPSVSVVPAGELDGRYLIDVYVHNVAGLRSYQMTLRAGGGEDGRLELDEVTIDSRREDYVFGESQIVTATSPISARLGAVLYNGTVDVDGAAYLGTYGYLPSANARGTFRINVEVSSDSLLANEGNAQIGFSVGGDARIAVGMTTPKADRN